MCPPTSFVCAILAALFAVASSNNCKTLQIQANGALESGTYTVQNSAGQSYRIYCQFYNGYGYTFLSTSTNVNVDMSSLYDDKSHVIIRHKRSNGVQYTSTMAQLGIFASNPVSVQYSGHSGYRGPQNTNMAPYIFVGFIPQSLTYKGALQGWKVNEEELTFENCNGNPNSYITFFFNPSGQGYTDKVGGHNTLMYQWYDGASAVAQSEYLPDEFFANYHEVHQGGCGGYSRGSNVPTGGAVGMKFTVECAVPANVNGAQMTYAGTNIGHTAKYTCLSGYQHTGGDLSHTCSGSGAWSGATPVCGNKVHFIRDNSVIDIQIPGGRVDVIENPHYKRNCLVECAQRKACVSVGETENGKCDLYQHDLTDFTYNIVLQPGTKFYKAVCPETDYTYIRYIGVCIKRFTTTMSASNARTTCQKDGASLLKVNNDKKMSYLRSTLAHLYADDRLFVLNGLYENATGWRWNGQSAVPIDNTTGSLYWGPGEPNLKSGKCVGVMSLGGYLKAFDCMQTAPFICEMDEK